MNKTLFSLRRGLSPAQKDRTWWNLKDEKAVYLQQLVGECDWQETTDKIHEVARRMAQNYFEKRLSPVLDAEISRLKEQLRRTDYNSGEFATESVSFQLLGEALKNWQIITDTAGFLAVNISGLNLT